MGDDEGWWPHQWVNDTRQPLWTVHLPPNHQPLGLYMLSIATWLELVLCMVAEAVISAFLGMIVYFTIVKDRRTAQLVGYGILLPLWIFGPRPVIDAMGMQHKIFRFCMCVIAPTTSIFRTMAAVHGFLPQHATRSLQDCTLYFGSPMLFMMDSKQQQYLRITWRQIQENFLRFLGYLVVTGAVQSLFHTYTNYFPKLGGVSAHQDDWYDLSNLVKPRQWRDCAVYAILFQLYLGCYGEGLMFVTSLLTGLRVHALMDNPIFQSSSPSDFWGRRWNTLIHDCLKNGVYKPVRRASHSKVVAVLAVFGASGLFHEWLLRNVFPDYSNRHGYTMGFFAWQGMLVALEAIVVGQCKAFVIVPWGQRLSPPLRTALVIALGLPLAHWFCDSYVQTDFFVHGGMLLPEILPIHPM